MQMGNDFKRDLKAAYAIRLPWWVLLCLFVGAFIIGELFNHWGRFEMALPVLNILFVIGFVVAIKWHLRFHLWYWIVLSIIVAIHILLILLLPWSTKWVPAIAIGMIDSIDVIVMLATFSFVG